jgi:hypothetical protein
LQTSHDICEIQHSERKRSKLIVGSLAHYVLLEKSKVAEAAFHYVAVEPPKQGSNHAAENDGLREMTASQTMKYLNQYNYGNEASRGSYARKPQCRRGQLQLWARWMTFHG